MIAHLSLEFAIYELQNYSSQTTLFVFINFNNFSFKLVLQNNFSHSLAANAGGRGFEANPTEGKFVFHNLLYVIEWNVKSYFVKLI